MRGVQKRLVPNWNWKNYVNAKIIKKIDGWFYPIGYNRNMTAICHRYNCHPSNIHRIAFILHITHNIVFSKLKSQRSFRWSHATIINKIYQKITATGRKVWSHRLSPRKRISILCHVGWDIQMCSLNHCMYSFSKWKSQGTNFELCTANSKC